MVLCLSPERETPVRPRLQIGKGDGALLQEALWKMDPIKPKHTTISNFCSNRQGSGFFSDLVKLEYSTKMPLRLEAS